MTSKIGRIDAKNAPSGQPTPGPGADTDATIIRHNTHSINFFPLDRKKSTHQAYAVLSMYIMVIQTGLSYVQHKCVYCTEDGRSMTTFYYYSVNHQSGLQRNRFSKLSYIFFNTLKCAANYVISFEVCDGFIGQKILKL